MSQAGAVLLTETLATVGLDRGVVDGAGPVAAAVGGARPGQGAAGSRARARDRRGLPGRCRACCAAEPGVFGPVASDPTVSRTIDRLADDATSVLAAIDTARAAARAPGVGAGR